MDIFCLGAFANPCASNNAQWLTEMGRLHETKAESATASPYLLRGPENEKREGKYW